MFDTAKTCFLRPILWKKMLLKYIYGSKKLKGDLLH